MGNINTYNDALPVLKRASKDFRVDRVENEKKKKALKIRCSLVDYLLEEYNGSFFQIDVDDHGKSIKFTFGVSDVQWLSRSSPELKLLMISSDFTKFEVDGDGNLVISVSFPGIWDNDD